MVDTATLTLRLTEAEDALHALMMGEQAVKVSTGDGKSIEYTRSSEANLRRYIASLQRQLGTDTKTRSRTVYFK
ncbi:hypothetical protein DDZ14_08470 [Maritimibacter sp. 55A14]|uniref:gpW family head-tail joining protein n=1 Tax=Maritimibacter sp. 55A14 TaxID=2174844 RepID=UPI000D61FB94|nr:gpW family head-tail joining protein [Maritimibacter sp. 55A14]PWE32770.1 hypothetical protein DDZ14_08470 [Maritimibacter sp. 55A14]